MNFVTNHLGEQVKRISRRHVGTAAVVLSLALAVALGSRVGAENSQSPVATSDWPLHSLNQHNTRYSPLNEIDNSNADRLVLKWSVKPDFQPGALRSGTPLVIDGVMYMNGGSTLLALDADTGDELWSAEVDPAFRGGGRGPAYGDGTRRW